MSLNRLKLNPSKETVWHTRSTSKYRQVGAVKAISRVFFHSSVVDLGVIIDEELKKRLYIRLVEIPSRK